MGLDEYFIIEVVLIEIWVDFRWFSPIITGKECLVWVLFDYLRLNDSIIIDETMWIFDVGLMIKNNDFDRVMLFVDFAWLESIDSTGVLNDFDIGFLVVC